MSYPGGTDVKFTSMLSLWTPNNNSCWSVPVVVKRPQSPYMKIS
uniref:Uncharacterized protein n=1 Tax=Triticum urartu TaxID=4572 RepID=A0A8R7QWX7_TRIUA